MTGETEEKLPLTMDSNSQAKRKTHMLTKDDLFTSVSRAAVNTKQDSVPKPEKRAYKKSGNKKRMPTQIDRYRVTKLLEEHLTPKDENGVVSYLNGMDDYKIAALIGTVSRDTVRHMRQEVFGVIRNISSRKTDTEANELLVDMANRIVRLEKLFSQLAEEIGFTPKV
jgi:hypothetical protein